MTTFRALVLGRDREAVGVEVLAGDGEARGVLAVVPGAQRVAVHVGDDLAEVVVELALEAGEPGLGVAVVLAVDGRVVLEDERPDRRVGHRRRLHLDHELPGRVARAGHDGAALDVYRRAQTIEPFEWMKRGQP